MTKADPDATALAQMTAVDTRLSDPWPGRLLHLAMLGAVVTLAGLAALWLLRNPLLVSWDEIGHENNSLMDAMLLRQHQWPALRDALFLQNRWLPPGLRLLGLPIAATFWDDAPTALRIAAGVLTLVPPAILYWGLRPAAGRTGAAAGALLFLLSPQTLLGAQSFMTELPLNIAAALAMALLLRDAVSSPRTSVPRLVVLGLALGLGALSKLTFLPTIGLAWVGIAAWRWWRDRDAAALWLRLAVPAAGLILVAWPHYVLNLGRYLAYAKATAAGYAFVPVDLGGLDFALFLVGQLIWEVLGLGGTALVLAALVAAGLYWRRLSGDLRAFILLALLAAAPPVLGFLFSKNQTERYLTVSIVILAWPVGLLLGSAFTAARVAGARALAGGVAAATLVQVAASWAVALGGPAELRPLRPLVEAAWRPNYACAFDPLIRLVPDGTTAPRLGIFGHTLAVNPGTVMQPFLRQGISARAIEIMHGSDTSVDWPKVLRDVIQLDLVVVPEVLWQEGRDPFKPRNGNFVADRSIDGLRTRLTQAGLAEDRGVVATGADPYCHLHVMAVRQPAISPEDADRVRPLRPEVHGLDTGR